MEHSFTTAVDKLRLGRGETFHGDALQAVAKALLQSGVSYIGCCQRGPETHFPGLLDDARGILDEMGIHLALPANEAQTAAMLAASASHPVRGAVSWNSAAGTSIASDALANVASTGVKGGALVVLAEDYGEGASAVQERSHAIAMKSQVWLLDPRPNLPSIADMVEKGFLLSEASNTPVMLGLRSRACHMTGSFRCKDNRPPKFSRKNPLKQAVSGAGAMSPAPSVHAQEKHKIESRMPAALKFIREQHLNEFFEGGNRDVGIILQGGLYNTVIRGLQELWLADAFGASPVPLYVLNVTYPLVPEEVTRFCAGKRAVLVLEEGQPNFIEDAINAILRRADINDTYVIGKEVLPPAGEYTGEAVLHGLSQFLQLTVPDGVDHWRVAKVRDGIGAQRKSAAAALGEPVPERPPGFCAGCPELPVFSALKLVEKELGTIHVGAGSGCHTFAALAPFGLANAATSQGLGVAGPAGIASMPGKRAVSVIGDGGLLQPGIASLIAGAARDGNDSVLVVMDNGYASAPGTQPVQAAHDGAAREPGPVDVQAVLRGIGVKWLRTVRSGDVGGMAATLREALGAPEIGLKVIVAEGECRLARQRRIYGSAATPSVRRVRFGIDEELCAGERSHLRLSGCPSLTLKECTDPLLDEPATNVGESCAGCGACAEAVHAAASGPWFYKTEVLRNRGRLDRMLDGLRRSVIRSLQRSASGRGQP